MLLSIFIWKLTKADTTIIISFKRSTCDIAMVKVKILNVFNRSVDRSTCIRARAIFLNSSTSSAGIFDFP